MMGRKESALTLLEQLAETLQCDYLSDLEFLNAVRRAQLVHQVEQIPPEAFSLRQWNDALSYLTKSPAQQDVATAKAHLLIGLKMTE